MSVEVVNFSNIEKAQSTGSDMKSLEKKIMNKKFLKIEKKVQNYKKKL